MSFEREKVIGQWVKTRTNGYDITGFVVNTTYSIDCIRLRIQATKPKRFFGKTFLLHVNNFENIPFIDELDLGEITEKDREFLVDASLIFRDKNWFNDLTGEKI